MKNKNYLNWKKESLINEILKLKKRKKYGLVWDDKPEDVVEQCKKEFPVLEEIKNKEIINNVNEPINLLIEGDNYHVLSVLNYTHRKKVDIIYIDPPYNTGAKDWKYNNNYVDEEDPYRHSKWLSMMKNRLSISKSLLTKNGVLICTIDKHEQSRLQLLLEEIFIGYEIVCITIIHNPAGTQGNNFSYTNEYAFFVYPKNGKHIADEIREDTFDQRNLRDVTGEDSLRKAGKNCFFPIIIKNNKVLDFGDVCKESYHPQVNIKRKDGSIEIYPIDPEGIERKWRFARNTIENIKSELVVKYIKKRNVWDIQRKKNIFKYKTVWTDSKFFANNQGTQLLNKILSKNNFPYPKSLYAVMECIKAVIHNKKDALILDYFAGSGTTGHAVLELNKKDSGSRRFILCTNNENKIATSVTHPRISKVIKGYKNPKNSKKIKGLGGNLKYFKTIFVPSDATDKNKVILTQKATEMLCIKEDTFEMIKNNNQYKIFRNKDRYTGIIFNHQEIEKFKKEIALIEGKFNLYIFSLGDDDFNEEFEDMKKKVKISPLPEAILRVYKSIFK